MEKTKTKNKVFSVEDLGFDMNRSHPCSVILHNDNHTPIDFVAIVLYKVFKKSITDATRITMQAHTEGQAFIASFDSEEEAQEKLDIVEDMNREYGFHLRITIEEN